MDEVRDLSDADKEILKFEAKGWRQRGAKESAIRDQFGLTPTQYYWKLWSVIQKPEALEFDPALVSRLHNLKSAGVAKKYVRGV